MTRTLVRATLFIFALTMSIAAFAASKSETVILYSDAQVGGKTLPAGEYHREVRWPLVPTRRLSSSRTAKEAATVTGQ